MRSRSANTWGLATESTVVPFWSVMSHERELRCEDPPFTHEGKVAAPHVIKLYILALGNLESVFGETRSQGALALSRSFGCLADIDKLPLEVQGVDAALLWPNPFYEGKHGA